MKKILLSIIFFLSTISYVFPHIDHYKEINYLEYELFRNNKSIGYHKYTFLRENNDQLTIKSVVEFKITKLNIDLYKYFAESEEKYKNGNFVSFKSKTNQNKKQKYVNISADFVNNELIIDGSSYKGPTSLKHIIGTWWNHEIIKAKAQISAISGRVIYQDVSFIGKEKITINEKEYNAIHFKFKSSDLTLPDDKKLNTDIWYDENSLVWLKASFDKRGYWEYRLKEYR